MELTETMVILVLKESRAKKEMSESPMLLELRETRVMMVLKATSELRVPGETTVSMVIKERQANLANLVNLFRVNLEMVESKEKWETRANQDLGDLMVKRSKENQVHQETQG